MLSLAEVQESLAEFVREESARQRKHVEDVWAMPVEERVEEGRCVTGGRLKKVCEPDLAVIVFPANDSRFREGDLVRASCGDPREPLCEAVIARADDEEIEVQALDGGLEALKRASGPLQLDESFLSLEKLFLGAIEDLGKKERGRERILPLLAGEQRSLTDAEMFESAHSAAKEEGLNDAQAEAVANALACDLCWLVHGPPGTGKTRVLAAVASKLMDEGKRVLVTSANHRAINNLLEAVARLRGGVRGVMKISPFPEAQLGVPQFRRYSDIAADAVAGGCLIGATPFATRSRRLGGVDFDAVLLDEAGQIPVPLAVMAMLAGDKYILAGDHQQLPPVCHSVPPLEAARSVSVFGRLVNRGMDTMLTVTHRLNEPLCDWPSRAFYVSRLRPAPSAGARRFRGLPSGHKLEPVLGPEPASVWLQVRHTGSRSSSPEETEAMAWLLLGLREAGVSWQDVAVVVPFRRQARLLRQRLRAAAGREPGGLAATGLAADTVERMQGQEREIVIISMTASDPVFAARLAEFLFLPQRLNVAATRARTKRILIASPELAEAAREFLPEELREPFLDLLDSSAKVDFDAVS